MSRVPVPSANRAYLAINSGSIPVGCAPCEEVTFTGEAEDWVAGEHELLEHGGHWAGAGVVVREGIRGVRSAAAIGACWGVEAPSVLAPSTAKIASAARRSIIGQEPGSRSTGAGTGEVYLAIRPLNNGTTLRAHFLVRHLVG